MGRTCGLYRGQRNTLPDLLHACYMHEYRGACAGVGVTMPQTRVISHLQKVAQECPCLTTRFDFSETIFMRRKVILCVSCHSWKEPRWILRQRGILDQQRLKGTLIVELPLFHRTPLCTMWMLAQFRC